MDDVKEMDGGSSERPAPLREWFQWVVGGGWRVESFGGGVGDGEVEVDVGGCRLVGWGIGGEAEHLPCFAGH